MLLFLNLKKFEQAVQSFKKAIQIEQRYFEAQINLGSVLIKLERFEDAIKSFDKVIDVENIAAQAFQGKAYSLMKLKWLLGTMKELSYADGVFFLQKIKGAKLQEIQELERK